MSDYTPTTEEVRDEYSVHCEGWCKRCGKSDDVSYLFHEAEFDRWLAEVKAKVWEEGRLSQYLEYPRMAKADNPYRQAERLAAFEKATSEDYTQGETE